MVSTHTKNISQNWESSPNRSEHKKSLSCHHLDIYFNLSLCLYYIYIHLYIFGTLLWPPCFDWKLRPSFSSQNGFQIPGSSKCVTLLPFHQKTTTKRQKFYISRRSRYILYIPRIYFSPVHDGIVVRQHLCQEIQWGTSLPPPGRFSWATVKKNKTVGE